MIENNVSTFPTDVFNALEAVKLGESSNGEIEIEERKEVEQSEVEEYRQKLLLNSEYENLERFIRLSDDKIIAIGSNSKSWYRYDDDTGRFILDNSYPFNFYLDTVCKEIEKDCLKYKQAHSNDSNFQKQIEAREKWAIKSRTTKTAKAVLELAYHKLNKGASISDYFDQPESPEIKYFNCLNCTLKINMITGDILKLPHSHKYRLTFCSNAEFDPKATCDLWKDRINAFMLEDKETSLYLQALLGLSIAGINKDQIFVILAGSGGNGKSTVLKHIQALMGDYGIKCMNEIFTKGDRGADGNAIADTRGKRFVWCSEGNKKAVIDTDMIKTITGGEVVACRPIYSDVVRFIPEYIPMFATNNLPVFYDNGKAIERRARVIDFRFMIQEKDKDPLLDLKLEKEYSGILNWLIAGFKLWHEKGCSLIPLTSDRVKEDSKNYLFANDFIGQFVKEELLNDPENLVTQKEVYSRYVTWCMEANRKPVAKTDLVKRLKEIYAEQNYKRLPDGSMKAISHPQKHGFYTIKGFKLKQHDY